jgi:uncharacterized protein (TIGR03086 family)
VTALSQNYREPLTFCAIVDHTFDCLPDICHPLTVLPSGRPGAYAPSVTNDGQEMLDLDRRAVELSARIVAQAEPADLGRATPCAAWNLHELLDHMITQHFGFAAASAGLGSDPRLWQVVDRSDPIADYAVAARHVIAAFARPQALKQPFDLPEISTVVQFPAAQAMSFHFVDYVAHGWDVARTLGVLFEPDDDLVQVALAVARKVPDGENRLVAGAAFGPGQALPAGGTSLEQVLAALGRSPDWPAASS